MEESKLVSEIELVTARREFALISMELYVLAAGETATPETTEANEMARRSLPLFRETGVTEMDWGHLSQGMAEFRMGSYGKAIKWLRDVEEGGAAECRAIAHAFQSMAEAKLGSFDRAWVQLRHAVSTRHKHAGDSNFNFIFADIVMEEAWKLLEPEVELIVPPDSHWAYFAPTDGMNPEVAVPGFHRAFSTLAFDDSLWQSGTDSAESGGGFGYQDPTGVVWETPASGKRKTAYLRHRFSVQQSFEKLCLSLQFDDGVVIYLDGVEAGRSNVRPDAEDSYGLCASVLVSGPEETRPRPVFLGETLEPGEHVLAISVHNHQPESSDLRVAGISLHGVPVRDDVEQTGD